jgi:acetyl esterase/lipase
MRIRGRYQFSCTVLCLRAALILASIAMLSACTLGTTATSTVTPTATDPLAGLAIQRDLAYGPHAAEMLDLCRPAHAAKQPGVILIHGGSWQYGDKAVYDQLCAQLAARGFVAVTLNYRLAPQDRWPAQLVDVQLAVRWLRTQANTIGLDPTRLCAYGDSAGGHLAVFLGVLPTIHAGDEATTYANQSPSVGCVVDEFGPVDLATLTGPGGTPTPLQQQALSTLLGGATPTSNPALYRDASPLFLVSAHSAPMLIVQGDADTIVPPAQSRALQHALEQHGVPVQYLAYSGDHEFYGPSYDQHTVIVAQTISYLAAQEPPEQ